MPINGTFFPPIDYLLLEGEDAAGTESYEIVLGVSGITHTGSGYFRVTNFFSVAEFGAIMPPASGEYEVLFRYDLQGVSVWESAVLKIKTGSEEGTGPVNCTGTTELPVGESYFNYTSWQMGVGVTISKNFCLRGGRSYSLTVQEFISDVTGQFSFLIDSLVLIVVDIAESQVLSNLELSDQYLYCVNQYRSLQTQLSAVSACEQVTFAVSSELYNGTLRK